ncbi:MAG: SDR family oxidoreductase [Alphaproteobacteria bacterium]|nr:SDR family oxidoreductase [Alphaproteobacteria bacterium]
MRIVITGGAGFLGRQLAERIAGAGEIVLDGRARSVSDLVLFDAVAAPRVVTGDIADRSQARAVIGEGTDLVFHLAAVVSGEAEADFDLGMRVNLDGTRAVLEACRAAPRPPRLVFASSIAVFGGDVPPVITDATPLTPQTSYGIQKAAGELLVADYSRKGFVDGRSVRLPTIVVRPGKPNKAASTFASSIIREPLAGTEVPCPVGPETRMWMLSPRRAVDGLLHAAALPADAWPPARAVSLPGIEVGIGEMVAALGRVAGPGPVGRISWQPDPAIQRIVAGWPYRFEPRRALAMGFVPDPDIDAIIRAHIDDQLDGRFAA